MATTSNLSSIIRFYAEKQKSPFIDLREFCAYLKKYAEHHVEEQAELVKYLGDPTGTVLAELKGLEEKHLAGLITANNKKTIVSVSYFAVKFANQFKDMLEREGTPYPVLSDLPKNFPNNLIEHKNALSYISSVIEKENLKSPALYVLDFSREISSILLPACVPIKVLVETSQKKIRKVLKKDEYHDYFLKKLRSTNPTKEISIKSFFAHFVDEGKDDYYDFSQGDDYYLWSQLCYFIRQDFEKIQDRTIEDINVLQAIQISEVYNTHLKETFQANQKREDALKELQSALAKPPFFYSMNQILKFQDNNGRLLFGQYSEDDLKEFLQRMTTEGEANELPQIVVFKVDSGTRYYVYKKKVIQLVVRLCNEAHDSIEQTLTDKWYNLMLDYEKLPEMTDNEQFELCLQREVEKNSPVLWALLNANFMQVLALEKDDDETLQGFQLFVDGNLLPYRELLMLKNSHIMAQAKIKLPFIYTLPIISWIIGLFNAKSKDKKRRKIETAKIEEQESEAVPTGKKVSKQEALAEQAAALSKEFIPEGSTLDRELNYLVKQWNKMITKEASVQLTEDVNSLIRDYTRRVVRTLSATSFTKERVQNLAEALVKTPNMQKIKEERALTEYVELYMLRLVSNKN